MEKLYNVDDINIYYTYKVVFKDYFYDYEYGNYYEQIYSKFNGFKLGLKINDMILDLESGKVFNFVNNELNAADIYIDAEPISKLNYFYNDDIQNLNLDKNTIIESFNVIKNSIGLDRYQKVFEDKYYISMFECDMKNRVLLNYYNDNNDSCYYDEYKEYRKSRLIGD